MIQMKPVIIISSNHHTAEVNENPSGSYSLTFKTSTLEDRHSTHNFFTAEEAARDGFDWVIRKMSLETEGYDLRQNIKEQTQ